LRPGARTEEPGDSVHDQLRGETIALRQVCRLAGLGLAAVDLVFAAGATREPGIAEEASRQPEGPRRGGIPDSDSRRARRDAPSTAGMPPRS